MVALSQKRVTEAAAALDAQTRAEKSAKAEYWITDPNARNFGNVRVKPGQKSVILEAEQAKMFLGAGLDTVSPEERAKQAAEAAEADEAHRAKHAEEEAARIEEAKANAAKAESAQKGQEKPQDGDGAGKAADGAGGGSAGATAPHKRTGR